MKSFSKRGGRDGRENTEIPVIPDPATLGEEERLSEEDGSIVIKAKLKKVKWLNTDRKEYSRLVAIGPNGKRIYADTEEFKAFIDKSTKFAVRQRLESLSVYAAVVVNDNVIVDEFTIKVGETYFRWLEKFGLSVGDLKNLTYDKFVDIARKRLENPRKAYEQLLKNREAGSGKPRDQWAKGEKERLKNKYFETLVILEACYEAGKKWFTARDTKAAVIKSTEAKASQKIEIKKEEKESSKQT